MTEPQAGSDLAQVRIESRSAGRSLPAHRKQDFHHLRRARLHREHHSSGIGAYAQCARRHQGHLALHRSEGRRETGRLARRAQRYSVRLDRAQARHPRFADVFDQLRRKGRRRRVSHRKKNEGLKYMFIMMNCSPLLGRNSGLRASRSRISRWCSSTPKERVQSKTSLRRNGRRCASSSIPTCARTVDGR